MPIYAFSCPTCGERYEELVRRVGDSAPCPACGEDRVELRLSTVAAAARGAGAPDYSRLAHHRNAGGCCGGACGHRH